MASLFNFGFFGNRIAIEAHVRLDGKMSLTEAHDIVSALEAALRARFGASTLVTPSTWSRRGERLRVK